MILSNNYKIYFEPETKNCFMYIYQKYIKYFSDIMQQISLSHDTTYLRNKLHYSIPHFWTTMGVRLNQDEGEAGHEAKLLCRWCWCRITVNVSVMILVIWSLIDIFIENGWYINFISFFFALYFASSGHPMIIYQWC